MSQRGHGGGASSRWAIFCKFLEKNGYFCAIWITCRTFSEQFDRTKFLMFESQLKKSLPLLQIKSKTRVKCCILGLNFVTWPKSGKSRYIAFCNIFSIKQCTQRFAFEDFCFVMKITSFRNICTTRGPGTLDSNSIICSISISRANFFSKAFCRVKTDEMEMDCYSKLVISSYLKLVH